MTLDDIMLGDPDEYDDAGGNETKAIETGTHHFTNMMNARRYYRYICTPRELDRKIQNGEIVIGLPATKDGETVKVNREGRYVIISQ